MPTKYLDLGDVAERAGIDRATAQTYHKRATANRRNESPRPGDLPAPDLVLGVTPGWTEETIDAWIASRPRAGRS